MRTEDYDYDLPEELIAQNPLALRDTCRLLSVNKSDRSVEDLHFSDLKELLRAGDRLVFNNTRVIPARLFGVKDNGVPIEFLFTEKIDSLSWKVIARPAKRLKEGILVTICNSNDEKLRVVKALGDGSRIVRLESSCQDSDLESVLEKYGHFPLPPYITREDNEEDRENYQTVFATRKGAIAAPTAGLHFTDELIEKIKSAGVDISFVTLHVGIGTFRPVKTGDPRNHPIHEEYYELSDTAAEEIVNTRKNGGRIIAVGTTVVRVLEHCAGISDGNLESSCGTTRLMILPPYEFKIVDGLITNFHLPRSTLLMLVSAFADRELVLEAYQKAINLKYRFFSYGDAMILT